MDPSGPQDEHDGLGPEEGSTPPAPPTAGPLTPSEGATAPTAALPPDAGPEGPRPPKAKRAHPYIHERSPEEELAIAPAKAAAIVLGGATFLVLAGLWLQSRYGYIGPDTMLHPAWESWTRVPLFAGLAFLGIGLLRRDAARLVSIIGWVLFGCYWALTSRDLLVREAEDYVNFVFAMVGVYLTLWVAYHVWLDGVRGVRDQAVRFLQVSTFVAAGAYFLIDKIQFLRVGLIRVVSDHTKWMLDLFGQGQDKGLVFLVDEADNKSPTTFFYPEIYCAPTRTDDVGTYCRENGYPHTIHTATQMHPPDNWFESMLQYTPDGDLRIIPISIILACTALQSIMLFVGLFAGTQASWQKKLKWSLIVGLVVYVLNLVRNTGIIWFYGQGYSSFWVMHNAIGKGGSLIAMLVIAFAVFRYFPEFLKALTGVLDLIDRDGPLERFMKIGRRRPGH